ncbi:MAG: hypothetical protein ACKOK8_16820, partial [Planctomycetia bacterium]
KVHVAWDGGSTAYDRLPAAGEIRLSGPGCRPSGSRLVQTGVQARSVQTRAPRSQDGRGAGWPGWRMSS